MDRSTLALYGEGGNRTATEAMLQGAQVQAQVATLIENKQSMFDLLMRLWAVYSAEKVGNEAGLLISENLVMRPLEAQEVNAYLALFADNAISHQTLLEELQRGHILSGDLDLEEELARIEEEKQAAMDQAMEQAMAMAEMSGPEDHAPPPGKNAAPGDEPKKPGSKQPDPKKEQDAKAGDTAPKGAAAAASNLKNTSVRKAQKKGSK